MATAFPSFTSTIRATSAAYNRRSVPDGAPKPTSANWWTPLFGWSSEADYINAPPPTAAGDAPPPKPQTEGSEAEPAGSRSGRLFTVGCFTEEKAKTLRKKTVECSTFHDKMYHSAIASRMASDLGDR